MKNPVVEENLIWKYSATATKSKMDILMLKKKKVILAKLLQMRKRAHHRELQLSNYHVFNFQYKTYCGSCVLGVFKVVWVPGYKDFAEDFFVLLCIHFWCVSDVALHWNKCLAIIKLTKKWSTSPAEAFHVEKSPKRWAKVFAAGIFLCVLRSFLWPGQRRNVQRICLQSFKAVPFSYLEFFSKWRSLNHDGQAFFFPEVFPWPLSSESLAVAVDLCVYLCVYVMPTRFDGDSAARSAKSWPPVTLASAWPRAGSECHGDVHIGRKSVFLTSRALVLSFLATLSMWFFSLLCWAHKRKNSVSFKAKSNVNSFTSHMWKMSPFEELVPMKKVRQKFYFWYRLHCRNCFSDGSCWEIIIIKQIHSFTSNILFEQRRFGLGCPSLYQVKWLGQPRPKRRCSNNMLLVNVWICLMK